MSQHETPCIFSRAVLVHECAQALTACTRSSQSHNTHADWLSSPRPHACTTSQARCTPRLVGHSLYERGGSHIPSAAPLDRCRRTRHTVCRTPPQQEIAALDTISCIEPSTAFPSWPQMFLACFVRPSNFAMSPFPPISNRPVVATR